MRRMRVAGMALWIMVMYRDGAALRFDVLRSAE